MSENVKNETTKVVVVANLKSPVVGFVISLFLGWFGIDRFYKGGIISILLGFIKLICGCFFLVAAYALFFGSGLLWVMCFAYIAWCILDCIILVPLGIVLDNRAKLARTKDSTKSKNPVNIADALAVIVVVFAVVVAVSWNTITQQL